MAKGVLPRASDFPHILVADPDSDGWLRFAPPKQILTAFAVGEVAGVVAAAQIARQKGKYIAGFVSYNAAPAFDKAHQVLSDTSDKLDKSNKWPQNPMPLAWFVIADSPPQPTTLPSPNSHFCGRWRGSKRADYLAAVDKIQQHITAGDVYQVNFTAPMRTRFAGCALSFFADLTARQPSPWRFFAETEEWAVCSASPECFFEKNGNVLLSRPMKGTRHFSPGAAAKLVASEKDRAENLMIVDMMRNDMSRLGDAKQVRAEPLLTVEEYPTVVQMTSTVSCKTDAGLGELFAAMFPCASVTGAPKIAAMEIIARLEKESRGVYCGACGWADKTMARFNVAIRTAVIDKQNGVARYDTGSGIVADSLSAAEWRECKTKAAILAPVLPLADSSPPSLLETMRADYVDGVGCIGLFETHLARMAKSANYFGIVFNKQRARILVEEACAGLKTAATLRMELSADGVLRVQSCLLPKRKKIRVCMAVAAVRADNALLQHKTNRRAIYDDALAAAKARGFDDAILQNTAGEITESCIANIGLQIDGEWYTPPLSCGLLPGVMRQTLLAEGKLIEKAIYIQDLKRAEKITRFNAVRGVEEILVFDLD